MKKIAKIISIIIVLLIVAMVGLFIRPDLSRDELTQYISEDSQFMVLPSGADAHYRDQGPRDAPVIVLVHGGLGSLHEWEPWIEILKAEFRVISMDLPGHGLTGRIPSDEYTRTSMTAMMEELLEALAVERFSLAGHSMGGGVILHYALTRPEQVESLILVAAEGVPSEEGYGSDGVFPEQAANNPVTQAAQANGQPPKLEFKRTLTWHEHITTKVSNPWLAREILSTLAVNQSRLTKPYAQMWSDLRRHQGNRYAGALAWQQYYVDMGYEPRDLEPRLKDITVPTLLLFGDSDPMLEGSLFIPETFHRELPDSQLIYYPNVGHMLPDIEAPESAYDVIKFIKARNIGQAPKPDSVTQK